MVQGAGRPGQPNSGQPSIFGNGGPSFAQMPSFTPVTRGAPQPAAPQPAAPQPATFSPPPQSYANLATQQPRPPQPQAFPGAQPHHPQPQAYAAPQSPPTSAPSRELPDFGSVDPGFPDSIFGDVKLGMGVEEETDADAGFPEDDASFPELTTQGYASTSYDAAGNHAEQSYQPDSYAGYQPEAYAGQQHETYQGYQHGGYPAQPTQGQEDPSMYGQQGYQQDAAYGQEAHYGQEAAYGQEAHYGQVPPADPSRQLQTLDPNYGQTPHIPLGHPGAGMHGGQQDYLDTGGDADFMDAGLDAPETGLKSKVMGALKGRSTVMVASALLGAIALGGALAYAYKQSGGGIGSEDAPIVTADASPVKAAPDAPGGKEFPHKNKLIYDRLTNGASPESERLVPRQEDVAVPALPPATATAGLPAPVATTDAAGDTGGPRKVQTMVVNPDGSVEAPAAAAAADQAVAGATDMANGMMAQPNMMPVPSIQQPGAAPQQLAAAAPAAATPADSSSFVVQLGSTKSQTDALANFADAQQKYPDLLGSYQPLVRKTDLGPKGTWYRLQVGPLADKDAAYRLCGQLKAKGHGDCLVMAQ